MDIGFRVNIQNIVLNHMADENFSIGNLASVLGLGTSYILKIKAATGKSVNQYITEFKSKDTTKLIKETDFTSAEIRCKVAFISLSYFS